MLSRFIYITGCDGTGKSTQARLLIKQLQSLGIRVCHIWLRFPFFFCLPWLAYARWQGYSWYEESGDVRHGYWDFRCSWMMRVVFPWLLLFDAVLAAAWRIYLPLLSGKTLVCERFIIDMLADLAVALDDMEFYRKLPGRLYFRLLPSKSKLYILDLDPESIRSRRPDLISDNNLANRLQAFRCLAEGMGYPQLSSQPSIVDLNNHLCNDLFPAHARDIQDA